MRLVLDTNVLISALFWRGDPHRIWTAARTGTVTSLTSNVLLDELEEVLTRATGPFRLTQGECRKVRRQVRAHCRIVNPTFLLSILSDEPDNRVLECAVAGKADLIVSGDAALARLREYRGIRILRPRPCWDAIAGFPMPIRGRKRRR